MNKDTELSGIIFYKTLKQKELQDFYLQKVGCSLWLDQGGCIILKAGNMLFGFCQREKAETETVITFFYPQQKDVDKLYEKLKSIAVAPPKQNDTYRIYHFYARDPEGRLIEFQYFWDPMKTI